MIYMGSKNRHAKELLPIILRNRQEGQWFVDVMCGGANLVDKVDGNRIANDINKFVIAFLKEMQKPDFELPFISEELWLDMKSNKSTGKYPDWVLGFAGYSLSFGGKWFNSYRREVAGDKSRENEIDQNRKAYKNIMKQRELLSGIDFYNLDYQDVVIPDNSIIYCDPPYADTGKYTAIGSFDHTRFWEWCNRMVDAGHDVYVSEYNAPDNWVCVWEKHVKGNLALDTGSKNSVEKLFIREDKL